MTTRHFEAAPWPTSLKVMSLLGSALLAGVGYGTWRAIPPYGFAHTFGSVVACVPPALALGSLLLVVLGYEVRGRELRVRRLLWSTVIPLDGLASAELDPAAVKCAIRVIGNAGLFSFTGLYQNARLGRFRLFATDPARPVVVRTRGRTVVVTPASPHALVEHLHTLLPGAARPHGAHGA